MAETFSPALISARLDAILSTIEQSATELKVYLEKISLAHNESDYTPESISTLSSFPFLGDSLATNHAAAVKVACQRLNTLVTPPELHIMEEAGSFYISAALRICVVNDIPTHIEHLSKDGSGAVLEHLSVASKLDCDLLGRVLRVLSQKGFFCEVTPGKFRNTASTSFLINSPSLKAYLDLLTYENVLASSYLEKYMKELFLCNLEGREGPTSPFTMFSQGKPLYDWLHLDANEGRGHNFNQANALARFLLLKMIVQDLDAVVKLATETPSTPVAKWIEEGRLSFTAHDFFTAQPESLYGSLFVLSNIIHNYPDEKALVILQTLRSARPFKLLIIDRLIGPFHAPEATSAEGEREIAKALHNACDGRSTETEIHVPIRSQIAPGIYDMIMATLFGAKTRTLEQWKGLLSQAGYSLVSISPLRASSGQAVLEAVIVDK
ncbi:hypothetical protein CVT24_009462 [Panaeolus cyanescens]|uniref:O-methyltransferase C-terminal domain-containing protein n=1 Tax=Panaeolus cyanescens TaxID=181874 RepID=A0A409W3P8_9AGAR|nr:hypothetical protein CVT24_009462 [Panaeolus cyanescens]